MVKLDLASYNCVVQHHTKCIGGVSVYIYKHIGTSNLFKMIDIDIGGVSSVATFSGLPLSGS